MRINPYAPSYYAAELAAARLAGGDAEGALAALKPVQRPILHSRQIEIVALVELGRFDEAKTLLAEHLAANPDETADRSADLMIGPAAGRYRQALIEVGMPPG